MTRFEDDKNRNFPHPGGSIPPRKNKPPEEGQVAPASLDDSPGSRRRRFGPGAGVKPAAPIMIMPAFNHAKSVDETKAKEDDEGTKHAFNNCYPVQNEWFFT